MATMKAAVIRHAGGPEALKLESVPVPVPKRSEVLIRVKAFGPNRSELFTRQGIRPEDSLRCTEMNAVRRCVPMRLAVGPRADSNMVESACGETDVRNDGQELDFMPSAAVLLSVQRRREGLSTRATSWSWHAAE